LALDSTLFSTLVVVFSTASLFLVAGVFFGALALFSAFAFAFALRSLACLIKSSQSYGSLLPLSGFFGSAFGLVAFAFVTSTQV
jgi:vacuolar-type H+-ATPase subunit I/STV1